MNNPDIILERALQDLCPICGKEIKAGTKIKSVEYKDCIVRVCEEHPVEEICK